MSNKSDRIFVIVEALTRYVHSSKLSTLHNDCSVTLITLQVYVGGNLALMDGTSASAPLAAAMISLINARRLQAGLGSVGYINPTIYANQVCECVYVCVCGHVNDRMAEWVGSLPVEGWNA